MKILGKLKLGEPDAHILMRHARSVLFLLLVSAVIATAALFVFFRPAAYLAALSLPMLFLSLVFVCYLERQSRAEMLRSRNQQVISPEEVSMNVRFAGINMVMALILLFGVATLIMAASMVTDWSMVGLVAAVLFILSSVMLFPYIPLFIEGSEQDQSDKHDRETVRREESEKRTS